MNQSSLVEALRSRISEVQERINLASRSTGRNSNSVQLIAVSKTFSISHVNAAIAAGLRDFGENRVQEALTKIQREPQQKTCWHLIGHLQQNKARTAVSVFNWIHSVDSPKLLQKIDQMAQELSTSPRVLIQVDLSGESSKHGASLDDTRRMFDLASKCQAVNVRGLMLLPPWHIDPERVRPYFRRLRELRDSLINDGVDSIFVSELSMGMSNDFEVAIQEGSTMVRVGTAIFGPRAKTQK